METDHNLASPTLRRLLRLRGTVAALLAQASADTEQFCQEPIVWCQLHVDTVENAVDDRDQRRFIVTIAPAGSAPRLRGFLIRRLADTEFGDERISIEFGD